MRHNYTIPIALGLLLVLVVAAALAGTASNNGTQQTGASQTTTATPSIATPSTQAPAQTQSAATPTGQNNSNNSNAYYEDGSESLCSKGAQEFVNVSNQSALQDSQSTTFPAFSFFLISSHYVASQNSCYIELHDQYPLPQKNGGGVADTYTLYVTGGPSAFETNTLAAPFMTEVATCATYPSGQTECNYYDPIEKDRVEGNLTTTDWTDQYSTLPSAIPAAPPMSQQDFQSLVAQEMTVD
jgi:hypothetical protein